MNRSWVRIWGTSTRWWRSRAQKPYTRVQFSGVVLRTLRLWNSEGDCWRYDNPLPAAFGEFGVAKSIYLRLLTTVTSYSQQNSKCPHQFLVVYGTMSGCLAGQIYFALFLDGIAYRFLRDAAQLTFRLRSIVSIAAYCFSCKVLFQLQGHCFRCKALFQLICTVWDAIDWLWQHLLFKVDWIV